MKYYSSLFTFLFSPEVNSFLMSFLYFTDIKFLIYCYSMFMAPSLQKIALIGAYNYWTQPKLQKLHFVDTLLFNLAVNFIYDDNNFEFIYWLTPYIFTRICQKLELSFNEFIIMQVCLVATCILVSNYIILFFYSLFYLTFYFTATRYHFVSKLILDIESPIKQTLIKNLYLAFKNQDFPYLLTSFIKVYERDASKPFTIEEKHFFEQIIKNFYSIDLHTINECMFISVDNMKILISKFNYLFFPNIIKIQSEETCSICLENKCEWKLSCRHEFCISCSISWLSKFPFCPMCKRKVES